MKNMTTTSRALGLGGVLALGALMASPTVAEAACGACGACVTGRCAYDDSVSDDCSQSSRQVKVCEGGGQTTPPGVEGKCSWTTEESCTSSGSSSCPKSNDGSTPGNPSQPGY
jgi:hypothetical protein